MSITIIIGPMACGKTHHKEALKKHFKAKRIVDDFDGRQVLKDGDLALAHSVYDHQNSVATIYNFEDVAKLIGIKPFKFKPGRPG
ncbi:MAG: hypothetical protein COA69_13540 [Robiginitomaculum sp.]|nr:MAG: hypothetical protein COA69_13540 [Robiginitomaculum sp.]